MQFLITTLLLIAANLALADNSYSQVRPLIWSRLYPDGGWTLYCNEKFPAAGEAWRRTAGLQLEHIYPAGWMARHLGCGSREECRKTSQVFNLMESDPHNIWPALTQYNQMRSDYQFGEIAAERWRFSGCDFEMDGGIVEPDTRARGVIARAMIYMNRTYGLPIDAPLFERWATQYPETAEERRRNALISAFWPKKARNSTANLFE